jgi:hypothetical protein
MVHDTYKVFLNGKQIDTVSVKVGSYDCEEMKRSLVNHDGYDPSIEVRKAKKQSVNARKEKKDHDESRRKED